MAYAGDLKSLAARIVGSSPTAPTIWLLRVRVPQGCGLVSFGRRWGSNPRGGERQADAKRPQRAGESADRWPKPVRICAANTRTSHRPYHVLFTGPCPPGMRVRFFWKPPTQIDTPTFFDGKTWLSRTFFKGTVQRMIFLIPVPENSFAEKRGQK